MLACNFAFMGLLIAAILKFFNSIVKLIINAASMYATAILTVLIWGRMPSMLFMGSLFAVTVAIILYNADKLFNLEASNVAKYLSFMKWSSCMGLLAMITLAFLVLNVTTFRATD